MRPASLSCRRVLCLSLPRSLQRIRFSYVILNMWFKLLKSLVRNKFILRISFISQSGLNKLIFLNNQSFTSEINYVVIVLCLYVGLFVGL